LPETPDKDPVVTQSLAAHLVVASLLLVVVLGWSLYDEFFGLRPWKDYQRVFAGRYGAFLKKQVPLQRGKEQALENSADYQALKRKVEELERTTEPQVRQVDEQAARVEDRTTAILNVLTTARAYVGSRIYVIDHVDYTTPSGREERQSLRKDLDAYERGPFVVALPAADPGGKDETLSLTFDQLEEQFNLLQQEKGKLLLKKADLLRPVSELQSKLDSYVKDHLDGPTVEALRGLQKATEDFTIEIRQINNADAGIVDRCESCHLGIREPVVLTRRDMGGVRDPMSAAFTSHPEPELLRIHDPERFGCTPCHNGNGMDVARVEKAHGHDEHWLWPLLPRENVEAGCQQCHASDMVVDHAATLSAGKDLFQWRGCVGCHRFQGYDTEPEDLVSSERQITQLAQQRAENLLAAQKTSQAGDNAPDNETARRLYAQANDLRLEASKIDLETDQLKTRIKFLLMDRKKVGPDLKEVRAKLRPEWVPVWLKNPHAFRPATRMPRFRLDEDELPAVAAFIWQSAFDAKAPSQPPGDPVKGKESFETRGCMGCHAVGEGANAVGGWFGANLSRVGEKVNYDYLVRWIHNPRERTRPYCLVENRDLGPEDYAKHHLPFVFDLEHSKCPNDGSEMLVEQMTPMPNLRLSWEESRDIASYLMTLKEKDPKSYAPAPYLNDPKLRAKGELIVRRYGCSGCHEIAGFENEGRIGTELTVEGSKPLEQLDFALYIRDAREQGWWSHKGFFEHKLARPEMFDDGLVKAEGEELKMPDFFEPVSSKVTQGKPDLSPEAKRQITELTTFLMGSVTSQYPERYFYLPEGQKKDIQEGWWVVKKYNCMACHQFTLDQESVLMTLPQYQTPDGKGQLPPRLVTEGARVNPEWLARFLANPALSEKDPERDGVRSYLKLRMPTFYFSPLEVRKLVRFFQALSTQPLPYIPPKLDPLSTRETAMARALFTSKGAPCLKCHAIGVAAHDRYASAPNFLLAQERLKPDWVTHWILDPAMIDPGTAMPSGLFMQAEGRWVFNGPTPPIFHGYEGDHANLLMRYLFELTPAEQQRLIQMSGGSLNPASAKPSSSELRARPRRPVPRQASRDAARSLMSGCRELGDFFANR
jgi:cytochrome c551/c552